MKKLIDEDYAEPPPVERPDAAPPVEGLPVGAPAPSFSLPTFEGPSLTLDDLLAYGKPVLLLFVSPNCGPCRSLLPIVRVWERDYADHLTIALLSKGTSEENKKLVAKFGGRHLLLQSEDKLVSSDYQAAWTPAAVLISREGKIASQATYGDESIRALVNHTITTGTSTATNGSNGRIPKLTVGTSLFRVGEPAPRFSLPDMRGREVHSEDLLGRSTMLLFWSPSCPFCVAMSGDLKSFEENPAKGAPDLAIVISGDATRDEIEAKAGDFKSLVLVDNGFDVGPLFGTDSTPSAVLIDEHGRIASTLATGHRNVLALAGIRKAELPVVSHN
jgi:thiol-disulfide isomerase/thioredoxin